MVNVEQFMSDYLAIKAEISEEVSKAENAVINMAISNGYDIDDAKKDAIVDMMVEPVIGNKRDILKFYEKYIVVEDNADNMVSEV